MWRGDPCKGNRQLVCFKHVAVPTHQSDRKFSNSYTVHGFLYSKPRQSDVGIN
jgi:hypothetical protein